MRGPLARRFFLQQLLGENQLLDLACTFVDAECADLAIETLDRAAMHDTHAAKELHGIVNHALGGFGGEQFRHRSFPRNAILASVARPSRAVDEQRAGVDGQRHVGELGLGDLEIRETLPEGFAVLRPCYGFVERTTRKAECGGANGGTKNIQRPERDAHAFPFCSHECISAYATLFELDASQRMW